MSGFTENQDLRAVAPMTRKAILSGHELAQGIIKIFFIDNGMFHLVFVEHSWSKAPWRSHFPICQWASVGITVDRIFWLWRYLENSSLQNSPALSVIILWGGPAHCSQCLLIILMRWLDVLWALRKAIWKLVPLSKNMIEIVLRHLGRKSTLTPSTVINSLNSLGLVRWLGREIRGLVFATHDGQCMSLIPSIALASHPWSRSTLPKSWESGWPRLLCMRINCCLCWVVNSWKLVHETDFSDLFHYQNLLSQIYP